MVLRMRGMIEKNTHIYISLTSREEVSLPRHVVGKYPRADAHRPQELVDVVAGVAGQASEDLHNSFIYVCVCMYVKCES